MYTIYKTTVFSLTVGINKNNLTRNGYFDLSKLKNLRILDNGFLKALRNKYNKTQKDMANFANVPLRTWIGWESYNKALPFDKLIIVTKKLRVGEKKLYKLIGNSQFTYGSHHGKNRLNIPIESKKFNLVRYLIPIEPDRAYLIKSSPSKVKEYILKNFSIDSTYFKKTGLITIYSYLLHRFLKKFYIYKKECLLKLPLSDEVKNWLKAGIDLKKSIIIPLALSDGGEKPNNRLFISGSSKKIHKIWSDAFYYEYGLLPSSFLVPFKSIAVTTHKISDDMSLELKRFCPNFKTSPIYKTKGEYFSEQQPSIKYLFNRPKIEQQIAIRLWSNTEGSIGIALDKRLNLITPSLQIACAHPSLIRELQYLCKINKINFYIKKDKKNWSGLGGLQANSIKTTLNFLKIGGFIRGTKINLKSKYFKNLDKQDVLLGILEFIIKQRKDATHRIGYKNKIYKDIREIVINKEFKEEKYYLDVFKDFNNWSFRSQ